MTFEQMKEVVKSYCNLPSGEADLRIGRSLNRHYKRVTAKCGLDATRFVTRTMTTTNGVQTVTFSEIERIDRILDTTSGVNPLNEVSLDNLRIKTPGTGAPAEWAKQTTTARTFTVRLDTVPQTAYTLQADGWTTLSDLAGSEEPVFPESFHDILPWSVIAEELLKKEKDKIAIKYEQKAEQLLEELQQHYAESYSQVIQARSDEAMRGASGSSGSGSGTLGGTAYTQTALVTFDLGTGNPPFAVVAGAGTVAHLDADTLDGFESSEFLTTLGHATSHENGGSDELDLTGLSGLLADSQTPLAHATSHKAAGTDPIKLDELAAPTDVTTLNATTAHHGLVAKLSGIATEFFNGLGAYAAIVTGLDTYIQFNDGGVLGADSGLTYDKTAKVIGVGSGVGFSATQTASANANTLDDYEEGTWTPADGSGASLSFTTVEARYVKIGQFVHASCTLTYPSTADASAAVISGLPFTVANTTNDIYTAVGINSSGTTLIGVVAAHNATTVAVVNALSFAPLTNANMSTLALRFTLTYRATA